MFTKRVFTHTMTPDFKEYLEDRVAAEDGITLWDNFRGYDGVHVYKKDGYYFFQLYDNPEPRFSLGRSSSSSNIGLHSFIKIKLTESHAGNIEGVFEFDIVRFHKIFTLTFASLFYLLVVILSRDVIFSTLILLMLVGAYWMEKRAFMGCFNAVIRPYIVA